MENSLGHSLFSHSNKTCETELISGSKHDHSRDSATLHCVSGKYGCGHCVCLSFKTTWPNMHIWATLATKWFSQLCHLQPFLCEEWILTPIWKEDAAANIDLSVHGLAAGLHLVCVLCVYPLLACFSPPVNALYFYASTQPLDFLFSVCIISHFLPWTSFDRGDFTRDIITPAFGVSWVGGVMAVYSAADAIVS